MDCIFINDSETELAASSMMDRLRDIEIANSWNEYWSDLINEYSLSWEVFMSSGLTKESVKSLPDDDFLSAVSAGMLEWDL